MSTEPRLQATLGEAAGLVEPGVPGLDAILDGGFVEGGLYLVEGRAGAGKTILSMQMGMARVARGERVAVVTLLAESHGKLIAHLRGLDFFDESALGRSLVLVSGYGALQSEGPFALIRQVAHLLTSVRPSLLVVDGFSLVRGFSASEQDYARFVLELNTLVAAHRTTTFLLAPFEGNSARPEHALVDGIVELSIRPHGTRRVRGIEIHKLRGRDPLPGVHTMAIGRSGIRVFPRLETVSARRDLEAAAPRARLSAGLAELDEMLGGGLASASSTCLLGAPGAGKTATSLKFLEAGARAGERCVYLGFYESPDRLIAKAAGIGIELDTAIASGRLTVHWHPPFELHVDAVADSLLERVRRERVSRLVVDGLEGLRDAMTDDDRGQPFTAALLAELRSLGVTSMVTEELPLFSEDIVAASQRVPALVDNIVLLRYVELDSRIHRMLSVMKVRENPSDATIREFFIADEGLRIGGPFRAAEHVLSGRARLRRRGPGDDAADVARTDSEPSGS
jgi:circadian clock protein KaiC